MPISQDDAKKAISTWLGIVEDQIVFKGEDSKYFYFTAVQALGSDPVQTYNLKVHKKSGNPSRD